MVFDSTRNQAFLHGGRVTLAIADDTWTYNGLWTRHSPPMSPPAREFPFVAYDASRDRVVVFGGDGGDAGQLGDIWEYDPASSTWASQSFATAPDPRSLGGMVYDTLNSTAVFFGGYLGHGLGNSAETWHYDGTTWSLQSPTTSPSARNGFAMAYDSTNNVTILFGGWDGSANSDETWSYNGTNWSLVSTANSPTPRRNASMAYDSANGVMVLFGGEDDNGVLADTWEFNGTDWVQASPATAPTARRFHAMTYDSSRNVTVLFGGKVIDYNAETWEYDGTDWTRVDLEPPQRQDHGVVFDSVRNVTVVFGGSVGDGVYRNDTWEWDGTEWTFVDTPTKPDGRWDLGMAFDPVRNETVMYGGWDDDTDNPMSDTWVYNGIDWAQKSPATVPPGRVGHEMEWDPDRQVIVMFGGSLPSGDTNEIWEWNGTDWSLVSASNPPVERAWFAMAYDTSRDVMVVFGGRGASGNRFSDDFWEFNGTSWAERTFPTTPPGRENHHMVYDTVRNRMIMFGGALSRQENGNDTWEYSGFDWRQITPIGDVPEPRQGHQVVFDSNRGVVVMNGGAGDELLTDAYGEEDSWEFQGDLVVPASSPAALLILLIVGGGFARGFIRFKRGEQR